MVVVVGGHSRNIGKTSVVCGIVRGLPGFHWTAIKITQHGHGVCSRAGEPCDCADPKHPIAISEEHGAAPETDSGRFLAAGARRAFWVRTPAGRLGEILPRLKRLLAEAENAVVESNSLLGFIRPDLALMVVDGAVADFKPTCLRSLDRADALVATSDAPLAWPGVPESLVRGKPVFRAWQYESSALLAKIRGLALKSQPDSDDITRE